MGQRRAQAVGVVFRIPTVAQNGVRQARTLQRLFRLGMGRDQNHRAFLTLQDRSVDHMAHACRLGCGDHGLVLASAVIEIIG
jgi:hypothetical protein